MKSLLASIIICCITLPLAAHAAAVDKIVVNKAKREMLLLSKGATIKQYRISLGDNPIGPKQQEGDERTPEGLYKIDYRNDKSSYHLSLHITYPNRTDIKNAKSKGVEPGDMIMIHGLPNHFQGLKSLLIGRDWTDGCIAVSNEEIEEIWRLVPNGTPILINP